MNTATMNLIEAAVLPLKEEAINRAAQYAQKVVDQIGGELNAKGWNLDLVAPFPESMRVTREYYRTAIARRALICSVTDSTKAVRHPNEADIRTMSASGIARFINNAKQDAAFQYDAFIAKLIKKIGTVSNASLNGSHVWGYSFLTVVTAAGATEIWKTQMILNVSKLGKVFNQFPTRKVKAAI